MATTSRASQKSADRDLANAVQRTGLVLSSRSSERNHDLLALEMHFDDRFERVDLARVAESVGYQPLVPLTFPLVISYERSAKLGWMDDADLELRRRTYAAFVELESSCRGGACAPFAPAGTHARQTERQVDLDGVGLETAATAVGRTAHRRLGQLQRRKERPHVSETQGSSGVGCACSRLPNVRKLRSSSSEIAPVAS
jgi:hypothetical protein